MKNEYHSRNVCRSGVVFFFAKNVDKFAHMIKKLYLCAVKNIALAIHYKNN
jgi:hypothetical protein